jgi:hypothetical protein
MVLVDPLFAPGDLSEAKGARCPMRNTLLVVEADALISTQYCRRIPALLGCLGAPADDAVCNGTCGGRSTGSGFADLLS